MKIDRLNLIYRCAGMGLGILIIKWLFAPEDSLLEIVWDIMRGFVMFWL
jgi:hypothetical protein